MAYKMMGLLDSFPFGKHRGKQVGEVLLEAPTYLLWIRDTEKPPEFSAEVHALLNEYMDENKRETVKYRKHHVLEGALAAEEAIAANAPIPEPAIDRGAAWGMF